MYTLEAVGTLSPLEDLYDVELPGRLARQAAAIGGFDPVVVLDENREVGAVMQFEGMTGTAFVAALRATWEWAAMLHNIYISPDEVSA